LNPAIKIGVEKQTSFFGGFHEQIAEPVTMPVGLDA
jgi:hypothetical protein